MGGWSLVDTVHGDLHSLAGKGYAMSTAADLQEYRNACEQKQEQIDSAKNVIKSLTAELAAARGEVERLHKVVAGLADTILKIDWDQVVRNRREPCCHVDEDGELCGRSNRWPGHPICHRFISLYILVRNALAGDAGEAKS